MLERLMYDIDTTAWAAWLDIRTHRFAAKTNNAPGDTELNAIASGVAENFLALGKHGQPLRELITTFSEYHEIIVPHPLDTSLVLYLFARLDDLPLAAWRRLILDDLID